MRLELHQGLGGVRFVTHGSGQMSLMGTMERPGERITGRVSISGELLQFCLSVMSHLLTSSIKLFVILFALRF